MSDETVKRAAEILSRIDPALLAAAEEAMKRQQRSRLLAKEEQVRRMAAFMLDKRVGGQ